MILIWKLEFISIHDLLHGALRWPRRDKQIHFSLLHFSVLDFQVFDFKVFDF